MPEDRGLLGVGAGPRRQDLITPAHAFFNWAILGKWLRPWWVVAGSVLPDAPAFAAFFYLLAKEGFGTGGGGFFGFVMANGNPNRQPGFVEASFLLHALPLYGLVGVAVLLRRRDWLVALWAGWGLHVAADYLTHVTDAYALLYPFFPEWRVPGVVSYWDPRHGAEAFSVIQLSAAALILAWIVGRRRGASPGGEEEVASNGSAADEAAKEEP